MPQLMRALGLVLFELELVRRLLLEGLLAEELRLGQV